MSEMESTIVALAQRDIDSLVGKLDAFTASLSEGERAAFGAGLAGLRDSEADEVQGYGLGIGLVIWKLETIVKKDIDGDERIGPPSILKA